MQGVGDHPGIPGNIAQCEWCGTFVNTFTEVPMHYCPNCHHGTLRDDCPHCHAPIAFPPQLNCLACGKQFTVMKLQQVPGGMAAVNIIEPDAERRKELEAKGNHWHDVVRGNAEGPPLPALNVEPPPGWNKEDFDRTIRNAKVDAGDDLTVPPFEEDQKLPPEGVPSDVWDTAKQGPMQFCSKCWTEIYLLDHPPYEKCPVCGNELDPPGLDSAGGAG